MKDIKFLDCTLRDGAHVVAGDFKHDCIVDIIRKLTLAKSDIIEFGFLKMGHYDTDKINYPHIEDAYAILDEVEKECVTDSKPIYALMARADEYDINELTKSNGRIQLIRVAFYYDFLDGGIEFARKIMDMGYSCSLNLINTPGSTMDELKVFVEKANEIKPFAVSIVDTFGVLGMEELRQILYFYDSELDSGIRIGLHVHENLSLAFALAQMFLDETKKERNVIVDGSLMGIGRAPGNLCTELIIDYLNNNYSKEFDMHKVIEAVDKDIKPFKKNFKWGYAPEFFLTSKYRVHRSYAEYLERSGVSLDNIADLLGLIDQEYRGKYNEEYIEKLARGKGIL